MQTTYSFLFAVFLFVTIVSGFQNCAHATDPAKPAAGQTSSGAAGAAPAKTGAAAPASDAQENASENQKEAQYLVELEECANFKERQFRLDCYDSLAEKKGFISADKMELQRKAVAEIGFWQVSKEKNQFGEDKIFIRMDANNTIDSPSGQAIKPSLTITCSPGTTEMYVDWKTILLDRGPAGRTASIVYKIDSNQRQVVAWEVSTDRLAVFPPDAVSFVRGLVGHKRIAFEITPFGMAEALISFDLAGIEKALDYIVNGCYAGTAQ